MKNKKFTTAVSPGHTALDQGAQRDHVTEYSLTCQIIGKFARIASEAGHICHLIGSGSNSQQIDWINDKGVDFGFELHFNNMASKPEWNGSLCMHAGSTKGITLAKYVNIKVANYLRTRNRGTFKGHHQLDIRNELIDIIKYTNCPFIVIEPCYLSNLEDFRKIDCDVIARSIFNGCLDYWEGVG